MTIIEVIASRLQLMGSSQSFIAEEIGTNPTQLGVFLKDNGTLPNKALNNILEIVGIDLEFYERRNQLANRVVKILKENGVTTIDKWSRKQIIEFTEIKDLELLIDIKDEETYKRLLDSKLIDVESTFPYFKALVSYKLNLEGEKTTSKTANKALLKTFGSKFGIASLMAARMASRAGVIGAAALGPVIGAAALGAVALGAAAFEPEDDNQRKIQKGSINLFSKSHLESLNTKAFQYIEKEVKAESTP